MNLFRPLQRPSRQRQNSHSSALASIPPANPTPAATQPSSPRPHSAPAHNRAVPSRGGRRPGPRTRTRGGVDRGIARGTKAPGVRRLSGGRRPSWAKEAASGRTGCNRGGGEMAPSFPAQELPATAQLAKTDRAEPGRPRRNTFTGRTSATAPPRSRARSPRLRRFPASPSLRKREGDDARPGVSSPSPMGRWQRALRELTEGATWSPRPGLPLPHAVTFDPPAPVGTTPSPPLHSPSGEQGGDEPEPAAFP